MDNKHIKRCCVVLLLILYLIPMLNNKTYAQNISSNKALIFSHLAYDSPKENVTVESKNFPNFSKDCNSLIKNKVIKYKTVDALLNKESMRNWKVKKVISNKKNGLGAIVFHNSKTNDYVIAFRGTEMELNKKLVQNIKYSDKKDMLEDILSVGLNSTSIQLKEASKLIVDTTNMLPKPQSITITGHSLGGYLAQMVTFNMIYNEIDAPWLKISTITFNAPGIISPRPPLDLVAVPTLPPVLIIDKKRITNMNRLYFANRYNIPVTNNIIKTDYIGNFGKHLGKCIYFRNMVEGLNSHTIKKFYAPLKV